MSFPSCHLSEFKLNFKWGESEECAVFLVHPTEFVLRKFDIHLVAAGAEVDRFLYEIQRESGIR